MATPAQINANRLNAAKSTGPRSPEGKSASRFNALTHGLDAVSVIIPGEDPAEYDALAHRYLREWAPRTASDTFHVDSMLRADWTKRRLQRVEAQLYRTLLGENPDLAAALLSDSPAAKLLSRIQRQIAAFERTWYRAHNELRRARREADAADNQAFERELASVDAQMALSELASIPQIHAHPDSTAASGLTHRKIAPPQALGNPALRL